MYDKKDYLSNVEKYSNMDGVVNPWGLAAGSGSITGIHLEDNSKWLILQEFRAVLSRIH